jgi:arginine decarboxylase
MDSRKDQQAQQAPIFNILSKYAEEKTVRFHVPGHKGGTCFVDRAKPFYEKVLDIDLTEITGLDDLHHPEGIISRAQELAASCFFADKSYFLINGSTVGNMAMILGTLQRGDQVLVQRNSHKSIFSALALAGVEAIFLEPESCPTFMVPIGIHINVIKKALQHYPNAKALVITYPNYYGMAPNNKEIIELAHNHGLLVLVDEAHGAHFGQHNSLPEAAMQLGADISVQSTHKMLSSMTMTSMLHIQGKRVMRDDIELYLNTLQSSSPSYPLMASLDLAREQIQMMPSEQWETALEDYTVLRTAIYTLGYTVSPAQKMTINKKIVRMDPYKLIISPTWELSGYELQAKLESYNIFCEMSDPFNILMTLPLKPIADWSQHLVQVLSIIAKDKHKVGNRESIRKIPVGIVEPVPLQSIQMRLFRTHEKKEEYLPHSIGKRAAEMILPYPPGVPILVPGETISEEAVEKIVVLQQFGAYFQGKNKGFVTIQVEV